MKTWDPDVTTLPDRHLVTHGKQAVTAVRSVRGCRGSDEGVYTTRNKLILARKGAVEPINHGSSE